MTTFFNETEVNEGLVLLVHKPLTWTSFDVVRKLKFAFKKLNPKLKIGHAGTLDPLAEGLLIVCTGKKTKSIESIQNAKKKYIAKIFIGATRPSYDKETAIDATFSIDHINEELIYDTLKSFEGKQEQYPPIYSAIKQEGKPIYLKARKGLDVEVKAKEIEIYEINIKENEFPYITFEVVCSKGTYIRSLAYDIGKKMNSGAYLDHLIRSEIGDYKLSEAKSIEEIVAQIPQS